MCVALGDGGTGWALDSSGSLWFRTGVCCSQPQGEDDHWWQVQRLILGVLVSFGVGDNSTTVIITCDFI